jgi:hypothetical protein
MDMIGGQAWVFRAFSVTASVLGAHWLAARILRHVPRVVAFLVTQRCARVRHPHGARPQACVNSSKD